jgi:hypothetical protein
MSTEDQLQRARELIKAKRYDDARKLLWKIDHPKAKQWLERIDGINPVKQSTAAVSNKASGSQLASWVIKIAAVVFVVGLIAYVIYANTQAGEVGKARARIGSLCIERRVRMGISTDGCFDSDGSYWNAFEDEIMACHRLSPVLDGPFRECLAGEGISP